MLHKIKKTISNYSMITSGDSVLVGLSGGPDSVCLLYVLKEIGVKLFIAHLNHGLRGKESDDDEKFCKELGRRLGIPVFTKKIKVKKSEDAARNARYKFLEDTAHMAGATKIALGHNADDGAETVLMRLLRGAGTKGLAGIPPTRKLGNLWIIRPLIEVWREEILDYLKKRNISYRIDSSNTKLNFFRNRIRHELIPFLSKYNPNIKNILKNTGRNMAMVNDFIDDMVSRSTAGLDVKKLRKLHPVIIQGLLRKAAESVGVNLEADHVDSIMALMNERRGSKSLCLPKKIRVLREYGKLIFCKEKKGTVPFKKEGQSPFFIKLPVPGRIKIPECKILIKSKLCKNNDKIRRNLFEVYLDYDRITRPLIIRNRRAGDVFQPIGLKGRKKVKDIFIDEKVPERYRDIIPIFVSGKDICWIPGYRIGENFKIGPKTKRAVKISAKGVEKLWQMQVQG